MAITLKDCHEFVDWALGKQVSGGAVPQVVGRRLANAAGSHLVQAHPWRWALSPRTELEIVNGQDWIELPDDFQALRAEAADGALIGSIRLTTPDEFLKRQAHQWTAFDGHYHGLLVLNDDTPGKPSTRLDIWPPGSNAGSTKIHIFYRRAWKTLARDTDKARLPQFCEELFWSLLEAFAKGRLESDEATLAARLRHEREQRELWRAAMVTDGKLAHTAGRLRNGAHTHHRGRTPSAGLASFVDRPE
jgi:hypothetical protein